MKIGDYFDLEKEKSYLCSDGSITHTVNVDALIQAVRFEALKEVVEWVEANLQYPTRGEGLVLKRNMEWQTQLKEWGIV